MAAPTLTYTLTNGNTADADQVMQDLNDLLNGITDGTKDLTINALTTNGAVTLNGHVTLGNGSIDDITVTGSLAASIALKTDGAFDIGSATAGLRALYFGDGSGDTVKVTVPTLAADYTLTLPPTDGNAGDVPRSDGSGTLVFVPKENVGLAASISSNILTVSLKGADGNDASATNPVDIVFRSSTATTGTPVTRSVTGALSLTLGTTAGLGLKTATSNTAYIYALDNAGTVELFASAHPFWDEGRVQSTSTTATSNQVLYGANARSSMAIRLIGRVKATWTSGVGWSSITNLDLAPFDLPAIACRVYKTAGEGFTSTSTLQIMSMSGISVDTVNGYNGSDTYTTAAAGKYTVMIGGIFQIGAVGFEFAGSVRIDATDLTVQTVNAGSVYTAGSYYPGFTAQWTGTLAAGQTIKGYCAQKNSGGTTYNLAGEAGGTSTWMTIERIGA
jgi:hypothetical protein